MGTLVPFVLQVQTARMAQGVSYLLGVAFYNRQGQGLVLRLLGEPTVSQRGARDKTRRPFGFGLLGEGREAPAGVRESKQQG
jgi:hypothetical protein